MECCENNLRIELTEKSLNLSLSQCLYFSSDIVRGMTDEK
jgi:hypothetical protein